MVVGKSEMQVLKRRGGRTDPWGTPLIMLKYINSLITTVCFWHCISQEISKKLFLLQTCDLSKIIVKSQQWPTPSESIAIYCVKETGFVCFTSSVLRKVRHTNKEKNYVLLLKPKLKFVKLSPNRTPPLNTATKLLNKPESQPTIQHTDWQKNSPHFRMVFVSDDHVVYNRPWQAVEKS